MLALTFRVIREANLFETGEDRFSGERSDRSPADVSVITSPHRERGFYPMFLVSKKWMDLHCLNRCIQLPPGPVSLSWSCPCPSMGRNMLIWLYSWICLASSQWLRGVQVSVKTTPQTLCLWALCVTTCCVLITWDHSCGGLSQVFRPKLGMSPLITDWDKVILSVVG